MGIVMATNGDCWVYSYIEGIELNGDQTTLYYFKKCSGTGQLTTGSPNSGDAGGLDIDSQGNLVLVSSGSLNGTPAIYVESGCNPTCALVGGPLPLQGAGYYGKLNRDSTEFAAADSQNGTIDVYGYSPTSLTYQYSFSNGLPSGSIFGLGVAYNPRSKE